MRILTFLVTSLLVMAVLAGIGFLITRESVLFLGSAKIENALSELKYINKNKNIYIQQCKLKGNSSQNEIISRLQLRFTSPQSFVTEVMCDQFPNDPIIVRRDMLPLFVSKLPGFSGIIWGNDPSGVVLEIWGRQKSVGVIGEEVQSDKAYQAGQSQPMTSCSGYSQMCCQSETQQGAGQLNDQVTDCPQSCYTACQSRPVVLSFTTDPFLDQENRTLHITDTDSVTFAFVVSAPQKIAPMVTIAYGDGQQETLSTLVGQSSHSYQCQTGQCMYVATITVKDQNGVESVVTPLTKIVILMQ